jgi:hypothetical protein
MTSEEYLKDRVENQIHWYSEKSRLNKTAFIVLQIITLAASASVPLFSIFSGDMWARILVAVLGSATAISTGIVSLCQYREHWVEYRTTAESLKHEKFLFLTKTEPYSTADAFNVLVERVEALVSQENMNWQQLFRIKKSEKLKT